MRNLLLIIAGLSGCLTGCATTRGQARELGAQTLGCPVDGVFVQSFPGAQYSVQGCGHSVDVDCQDPSTVDRSVHPEGHSVCRAGKPH